MWFEGFYVITNRYFSKSETSENNYDLFLSMQEIGSFHPKQDTDTGLGTRIQRFLPEK
jgi:hypothetical protein